MPGVVVTSEDEIVKTGCDFPKSGQNGGEAAACATREVEIAG